METRELTPEPGSVRLAREFVSEVVSRSQLPAWKAMLVASELVTNVIRHAGTPFLLRVHVSDHRVRIEVQDGATAGEIARKLAGTTGGFGLGLVDELTEAWGVRAENDGKTVWVELDRDLLS